MSAVCVQSHISDASVFRNTGPGWLLVSGALVIRSERQLGQVSTAALCRKTLRHGKPDPGGRAGRARCWVLRERPLVGQPLQDRLPRSLMGGGQLGPPVS